MLFAAFTNETGRVMEIAEFVAPYGAISVIQAAAAPAGDEGGVVASLLKSIWLLINNADNLVLSIIGERLSHDEVKSISHTKLLLENAVPLLISWASLIAEATN